MSVRVPSRAVPVGLAGWAVVWFAAMAWHGGLSWHFFVQGAQALPDADDPGGGLHLYAAAPVLQIGPVAFLVTEGLRVFGGRPDLFAAQVLGAAGGAYILWQAGRLGRRRATVAVVFFVPVWMYLAVGSTHLDDVLALVGAVAALAAARAGKAGPAGLFLGLAVDAKPWALGFAALLLMLPGVRAVLRGAVSAAAAVAAAWLPFFLADPRTNRVLHFTIANTPLSALRALGVTDARTPPWDRPVQAALGIALGLLAVRRGRWPAVLLLAVAARIALDPGTNRYYAASMVVGALIWDMAGSSLVFPWWSAGAALVLFASRWLPLPPAAHGWLTLAYCLACLATLFLPGRTNPDVSEEAGPWVPPPATEGAVPSGGSGRLDVVALAHPGTAVGAGGRCWYGRFSSRLNFVATVKWLRSTASRSPRMLSDSAFW
jgi:hypothetical protein